MTRTVFASTSGMPRLALDPLLAACVDSGLRHVELSAVAGGTSDVRATTARYPALGFLVHNYFPPPAEPFVLNLADQDPAVHARSVALCEEAVALCAALGAPFYTVHAGFRATLEPASLGAPLRMGPIAEYDTAYATLVRTLEHLIGVGVRHGVRILVEPNVLAPFNLSNGKNEVALLCEPKEVPRLAADLPRGRFGLLLDTGHLNVTARTLGFAREAFIDAAGPFIGAFHVHENDGTADSHQPVTPDSWVLPLLWRREFAHLPIINEAKFSSFAAMQSHSAWLGSDPETDAAAP